MTFWDSPIYRAYESAYGDAPGTRSRLLASADWDTQLVDLTLSEAELWTGIRKSYKALIHKAERQMGIHAGPVQPGCPESIVMGFVNAMRLLHDQCAGRETRPASTWSHMGKWIASGQAMTVQAVCAGPAGPDSCEMAAYAYFVIWEEWSYYFSAASVEKNLAHALIWTAMKALKARGVRTLELGWLARAGDTEKDRGIVKFKQGFGGQAVSARPIKFYAGEASRPTKIIYADGRAWEEPT